MGAAAVELLQRRGATVVGADIAPAPRQERVDIADEAQVDSLVARVVEKHGRLDGAANFAAIPGKAREHRGHSHRELLEPDRPARANAIDSVAADTVAQLVGAVEKDDGIDAVILTGAGDDTSAPAAISRPGPRGRRRAATGGASPVSSARSHQALHRCGQWCRRGRRIRARPRL
ncbi:hypothetical protein [Georgenia sp. AZ-5]|uniref:hypothetical protein n=1 Tax=Georgenia sp. AZ-5 TaxID=3367526 RepID=UPI0037548220